jgi:hypothetical protein
VGGGKGGLTQCGRGALTPLRVQLRGEGTPPTKKLQTLPALLFLALFLFLFLGRFQGLFLGLFPGIL